MSMIACFTLLSVPDYLWTGMLSDLILWVQSCFNSFKSWITLLKLIGYSVFGPMVVVWLVIFLFYRGAAVNYWNQGTSIFMRCVKCILIFWIGSCKKSYWTGICYDISILNNWYKIILNLSFIRKVIIGDFRKVILLISSTVFTIHILIICSTISPYYCISSNVCIGLL